MLGTSTGDRLALRHALFSLTFSIIDFAVEPPHPMTAEKVGVMLKKLKRKLNREVY